MTFADKCLKRANKAEEGPWKIRKDEVTGQYSAVLGKNGLSVAINLMDDDARFIAHARTDVVELANRLKSSVECLRILESRLESDDVFYNTRKALRICIEQLEKPLEKE